MHFVILILGFIGFCVWILRQPAKKFLVNLGVFPGTMFLSGNLLQGTSTLPNSYVLTLAFFMSIVVTVSLARIREVR